jgi:cyclase
MRKGYDIQLLKAIKERVEVPLVASGGAGRMEDFLEAIVEADVEGVLAASVFHYKEIDIGELKSFLKDKGIEVSL